MIEYVSGDLLQSNAGYIAQGVAEGNQEGLGTGLALKISMRWPDAQSAFKKYARSGSFKGGKIWVFPRSEMYPGIVYMATQPDMYHAVVPYVRRAFRNLVKWADREGIISIALPKVGAGLGKLSWGEDIKPLMEEHFTQSKCHFIVYELFKSEFEVNRLS